MTELKTKINALQNSFVQLINGCGLPLEVSELVLKNILSELSAQINAAQPVKGGSDEIRDDNSNRA